MRTIHAVRGYKSVTEATKVQLLTPQAMDVSFREPLITHETP